MAQRLAQLVDGINPEENIYLSAHRVAWLRKRPPATSAVFLKLLLEKQPAILTLHNIKIITNSLYIYII